MDDRTESHPEADAKGRFLTFRVERQLYALPAEAISEVIRIPSAARVPQSPAALLGIANLRGTVLPLVSLRGLLDMSEAGSLPDARAIVLAAAEPVALAVDSVDRLVSIDTARIESHPAGPSAKAKDGLKGAFQAGSDAAKILDIQNLLEGAFAERAGQQRQTQTVLPATPDDAEPAADVEMLVTFEVAGQEFALRLDAVEEIVSAPDAVARMPDVEDLVLGMTTFRDRLLPLLSLRGLLGLGSPAEANDQAKGHEKVLVVKVGTALVGLVADSTRAMIAAERDRLEPIPSLLAARTGGEAKISAVYRGDSGQRLVSILSPDRLFREDVMRRLASAPHAATAEDRQARAEASVELKFLVFRLGADEFGLPVECVDEVARVPEKISRVPKTPRFLEGVVNLRGEVLPVVDQRRRFDMPKLADGENRRLIVVRTDRHRAGLIVDSVSEILGSVPEAIEAPPRLTDDTSRLIQGVVNLEAAGRIVLLLDPRELLTRAERGLLDSFKPVLG